MCRALLAASLFFSRMMFASFWIFAVVFFVVLATLLELALFISWLCRPSSWLIEGPNKQARR